MSENHQSLLIRLQSINWQSLLKRAGPQLLQTHKHLSLRTTQTLKACKSAMNNWSSRKIIRQSTRVRDWLSLRLWYSLNYYSIIIRTRRGLKESQAESNKPVRITRFRTKVLLSRAGILPNGPKTPLTKTTKSRPISHSLSCAKVRKSCTPITQPPLIKASITKNQTYPR